MKTTPILFPNIGYNEIEFSEEELFPLKQEIFEIQKNNFNGIEWNSYLAGNIEKSFVIEKNKEYLQNLILPSCFKYDETFNHFKDISILTKSVPLVLHNAWVNFQKKGEFNPAHNHTGVMSFVIWIQIPYNIEDEMNVAFAKKANGQKCGTFSFLFTNVLGQLDTITIYADKKFENRGLIFPSEMYHAVYPFFTSDDYRISISGNFRLDNS